MYFPSDIFRNVMSYCNTTEWELYRLSTNISSEDGRYKYPIHYKKFNYKYLITTRDLVEWSCKYGFTLSILCIEIAKYGTSELLEYMYNNDFIQIFFR